MNKFFHLLIIVVIGCARQAPEVEIIYYPNGIKKSETELLLGLKNGEKTTFFPNGNIKTIIHFKNDTIDGLKIAYSVDSVILEEITYVKGTKQGLYMAYHPNGKAKRKGYYLNDHRVGFFEIYSSNGLLESKIKFALIGKMEVAILQWQYSENGKIVNTKTGINLSDISKNVLNIGVDDIELYDSAILIYGQFSKKFIYEQGLNFDTLNLKSSLNLTIKPDLLIGDSGLIRGKVLLKRWFNKSDTTHYEYSFKYFEKYTNIRED